MPRLQILEAAKKSLAHLLDQPGAVFYSSYDSLAPGDLYFLGFNPGGASESTIGQCLDKFPTKTSNSYLDEIWDSNGRNASAGQSILQKRVTWVLEALGHHARDVCSSNLIFARSRDAVGVPFDMADVCWPVHEAVLNLVKPKTILCCGNSSFSAYAYLKNRFGGQESSSPPGVAEHGNWQIKSFKTEINGRKVVVIGMPHLSRYDPVNKLGVIGWMKNQIET
jgi:hypothetical protein